MASLIQGVTVELIKQIQVGVDAFNNPIYEDEVVPIPNVLIMPLSDEEIVNSLNLTGRKATYQLAIPKGDTHDWENQLVRFFGEVWRVIGKPVEGIEHLIPLDWNKKVKVESIGGE